MGGREGAGAVVHRAGAGRRALPGRVCKVLSSRNSSMEHSYPLCRYSAFPAEDVAVQAAFNNQRGAEIHPNHWLANDVLRCGAGCRGSSQPNMRHSEPAAETCVSMHGLDDVECGTVLSGSQRYASRSASYCDVRHRVISSTIWIHWHLVGRFCSRCKVPGARYKMPSASYRHSGGAAT